MNIPVEIVVCFVTAIIGLQGWTLLEVVKLRASVAVLMDEHNRRNGK